MDTTGRFTYTSWKVYDKVPIKVELPEDADKISKRDLDVCKRVKTFHDLSNGWRFSNRPDFQTPFAFAEAGFVCTGSDSVYCEKCENTFSEWELTDVPLTEHKKIVQCPFVHELSVENIKNHPSVRYALENELVKFDEMVTIVKHNPQLLDQPLDKFLCSLIKIKKEPDQDENRQWDELLQKYQVR